MDVIDLQHKTRPERGRIASYWFENEFTGLERTLFHRIEIPFAPFDTGLDWVHQPEAPALVVEWIELGLADPAQLDGVVLASGVLPRMEASIYVGSAHNWVEIHELRITKVGSAYRLRLRASIDFETEGVGKNEDLELETLAAYEGEE